MTKLYVGNLPFTATEEAVRNLFAPHGTVEKLSLINDRTRAGRVASGSSRCPARMPPARCRH